MPHIQKAIVHALDTNAGAPVLSGADIQLTPGLAEYFESLLMNHMESDGLRHTRFHESSAFAPLLGGIEQEFVSVTGQLAGEMFRIMFANPAIPAGDLVCLLAIIEGEQVFAAMKLPYKSGFSHYYEHGANSLSIIYQQTLLPAASAKPDEAFAVNLATGDVLLAEKKYEVDGEKAFYLSRDILDCGERLAEREKLNKVQKAVKKVNEELFNASPEVERQTANAIRRQFQEGGEVRIETLCEEIYPDNPEAVGVMKTALESQHVEPGDTVRVSAKAARRLEKQSLKAANGIEIKIPVELYANTEAVEFINNPDGTITVVVKNLLV